MKKIVIGIQIITLAVLLSGCSNPSRTSEPAPIVGSGGEHSERRYPAYPRSDSTSATHGRPSANNGEPQIAAYQPPANQSLVAPMPGKAVQVLMRRAKDQQRAGDDGAAAVSLERALRIAPRNADLLHQLAGVRMKQKKFQMAAELAAKSNSMTTRQSLQHANWLLIAKAKRQAGDKSAARKAEQEAALFK